MPNIDEVLGCVFGAAVAAIILVVFLLLGSAIWDGTILDRNAWAAASACQARGENYTRKWLTTRVVCIPRYRGADSLHVTGVTK